MKGLKVAKSYSWGQLLFTCSDTLARMYRLSTVHSISDRQDRWHYDANSRSYSVQQCDRL